MHLPDTHAGGLHRGHGFGAALAAAQEPGETRWLLGACPMAAGTRARAEPSTGQSHLRPPRAVSEDTSHRRRGLCRGLLSSHGDFLAVGPQQLLHSLKKTPTSQTLPMCILFARNLCSFLAMKFLTPPPRIAVNNAQPSDRGRGWTLPSDSRPGGAGQGTGCARSPTRELHPNKSRPGVFHCVQERN